MKKLLGVAGLLIVAAGIGFLARPVSYYNEAAYLRESLSGAASRSSWWSFLTAFIASTDAFATIM